LGAVAVAVDGLATFFVRDPNRSGEEDGRVPAFLDVSFWLIIFSFVGFPSFVLELTALWTLLLRRLVALLGAAVTLS
jgi:hypothetical protein